jgi:hypothetical protein
VPALLYLRIEYRHYNHHHHHHHHHHSSPHHASYITVLSCSGIRRSTRPLLFPSLPFSCCSLPFPACWSPRALHSVAQHSTAYPTAPQHTGSIPLVTHVWSGLVPFPSHSDPRKLAHVIVAANRVSSALSPSPQSWHSLLSGSSFPGFSLPDLLSLHPARLLCCHSYCVAWYTHPLSSLVCLTLPLGQVSRLDGHRLTLLWILLHLWPCPSPSMSRSLAPRHI